MEDVFLERTRRLQQRLLGADAAGAIFFPSPNLFYLTGFWEEPMERHLLLFVPPDGDPVLVAPALYESQLQAETWVERIETYSDSTDPAGVIADVGDRLGMTAGTVLVDPTMWARFTLDLRQALPSAEFELADAVMADLRQTKDDPELDRIARASELTDAVMDRVRDLGPEAVGMTEAELAAWIRDALLESGDSVAFDVVVGSGPNGAKPHHRHGEREIEAGDPVVLDFGLRRDHYPSDTTRTVVFDGAPPAAFETVHEVVAEAQEAAVEAVEPGVPAESIDAAARSVIEAEGYGDEFIHRTGHGLGLDVHEDPYIVSGNDDRLEPGMVFSVEPGIYLEGEFGVRIEDLVVMTEDGGARLNTSPRGWEA